MEPPETRSPLDDPRRLAIIRRLGLLDTPPEEVFDRLTKIAASLIDAPIALCSIVSADKQFFKSEFGLSGPIAAARETPLSYSFCQHVVLGLKPLVVPDARKDQLLKDSPAVEELDVIAYAGIPLLSAEGEAMGSFCVVDNKPRDWTPQELSILKELAGLVMREFQLRDASRQVVIEQQARQELTNALIDDFSRPLDQLILSLHYAVTDAKPTEKDTLLLAQQLKLKLNNVVDISQLNSGQLNLDLQRLDIGKVVLEGIVHTKLLAQNKQISVESHIDSPLKEVSGDDNVLVRVVTNILRHAISFTDAGSVVYVQVANEGHHVRCSVSDTGVGLSDEAKENIFNTLLPPVTATESASFVGLGLTYCRAAIEAQGGTIGALSQEGVGTTIWFTLPAAR